MKLFRILFFSLIVFSAKQKVSGVNDVFASDILHMQKSISECTVNIARATIRPGSIIAVVKAGIKRQINNNFWINTNDLIVESLMKEMRWNIISFRATTYKQKERVCTRNAHQARKILFFKI